jgi:hypothetical protein
MQFVETAPHEFRQLDGYKTGWWLTLRSATRAMCSPGATGKAVFVDRPAFRTCPIDGALIDGDNRDCL